MYATQHALLRARQAFCTSIMNFISHLGSAIARDPEADTPRARSGEIRAEGEGAEEVDAPVDQPVGGSPPEPRASQPPEPPPGKAGCGCFG